ncbi:Uncharacterized protein XB16_3062 [Leptospira santarosai]|uniref:Uncharacterized protein n=1 Tax=Leptospira santarosai TaxID=28183 RepID=A0A2P1QWT1_9LEPT|nr:Uncharacterized protein XB16_3062 [Leptospira santarosai]
MKSDQFPDLSLDSIRLNNDKDGIMRNLLMKFNSSGAMAGMDTIYRLSGNDAVSDS